VGPLTILHVVAPGPVGGLESVVRALAVGHHARGHQVRVVAVLDGPRPAVHPFLDSLEAAHVTVMPVTVGARAYRMERAAITRICAETSPDVVHSHGYRTDVVDAGAARRAGIPTVTTVHGFTGGGWRNRAYEWLQLRAFRRFDAVVAVSRPLVQRLGAAGVPAARTHLIPNAFMPSSTPLTRAEARARLGLETDAFTVGWVGRLSHEKGADVLLDALTTIDVDAVIIGAGRDARALRAHPARVHWAGAVPAAATLLAAFDVFVLSSRTEGTPIVLLEAMAAGIPVIATTVGGVPDVVSPAEAILVPPAQPAVLARAIITVRDDPAGAAVRAAAARRRLEDAFAPEPWLRAYESLYASVAR
jgi:glycosyltransferase involved in cell wall biosynthesis